MGTCTPEDWIARLAMAKMTTNQAFAFLLEDLPENVIESVVSKIRNHSPNELRAKVETEFLARKSVEAAKEYQKKKLDYSDSNIQKMLRISVKLMRSSFKISSREGMNKETVAHLCLQLFSFVYIDDNIEGAAKTMLRKCGEMFDRKELRALLDDRSVWAEFLVQKKARDARELLCAGYNDYNGSELAFVATERDVLLSSVTMIAPYELRINALKKALVAVNVNNRASVNKAMALFYAACQWPGVEKAKAAVMEVRSDLVEHFTDDSSSTIGKKAE